MTETFTTHTDIGGEARRLLELALHLRMYGECAPGGHETWAQFDADIEHYLRGLPRPDPLPHACAHLDRALAGTDTDGGGE